MPPISSDDQYQIEQIANEIFYDGNMPDRDHRWRCFEYSFYAFYRTFNNNETINLNNNLRENWAECGKWKLGDWNVTQFSGTNLNTAFENEVIVRRVLEEYFLRNSIMEFRTRFSYPKLP